MGLALFPTLLYRSFIQQRGRWLHRIPAHMAFPELVACICVPSREITTGQEGSNISLGLLIAFLHLKFRGPVFLHAPRLSLPDRRRRYSFARLN